MEIQIPIIVETLYHYFVTEPNPKFWPEYLRHDPVKGHSLWAFYRGMQLGMQVSDACREK